MAGSFRRRLLAIAALTVLVCAAAITALLVLSRTANAERIDHARDNVTREVEGLRGVLEAIPLGERPHEERESGTLSSGYVADRATAERAPLVIAALDEAARTSALVVRERLDGDSPVLAAAMPVPGGGFVFALQHVVAGRETRGLRLVVVALALLSFLLVGLALRTLSAVDRGVSGLRSSLAALAKDLRSPIARPTLRELDEVATGVAALADDLDRAQRERERLLRELGERERLAALGRVAAGIAHEVRNPLASMKLRADLARAGGEATPAIARDLEDIASEIGRLDRLVSDLLVVAGRRAGPAKDAGDTDLGDLVARRVALLAPWATEKKVTVTSDGHAQAQIDIDAVARAIDNLVRNAVEASPSDARVEVRVGPDEGGGARVVVVDRGAGVPPERAAELFEPFFTTKPDGTGLGLALARAVASAHHGTLRYARHDGATQFTLTVAARALG